MAISSHAWPFQMGIMAGNLYVCRPGNADRNISRARRVLHRVGNDVVQNDFDQVRIAIYGVFAVGFEVNG